jgi:FkbM family methyltransferase
LASSIAKRAIRVAERMLFRATGWDCVSRSFVRSPVPLAFLGTTYGGWTIPDQLLNSGSICYCVGVGEDISFDLELIRRYRSNVYAFDPTPRAIAFVEDQTSLPDKFKFVPVGIWNADKIMRFYVPGNPNHVSHSIVNLQKTEAFFEAPCRKLSSFMREHGHERLDLLKIDIEGAEYQVIQSLLDDNLDIRILCVEFDETNAPVDGDYGQRIRASILSLAKHQYMLVARSGAGNFTFLRTPQPPRPADS